MVCVGLAASAAVVVSDGCGSKMMQPQPAAPAPAPAGPAAAPAGGAPAAGPAANDAGPPPPPPGTAPLPPGVAAPPPPARIGRFELGFEQMMPQGNLDKRVNAEQGVRLAFGAQQGGFTVMAFTRATIQTEDKAKNDFYYFDLIGIALGGVFELAPNLSAFFDADVSLTGVSVLCNGSGSGSGSDDFCLTGDLSAFEPRVGIGGRVGGIIALKPQVFELYGALGYTQTEPDEGGWFSISAGLIAHFGQVQPTPGAAAAMGATKK